MVTRNHPVSPDRQRAPVKRQCNVIHRHPAGKRTENPGAQGHRPTAPGRNKAVATPLTRPRSHAHIGIQFANVRVQPLINLGVLGRMVRSSGDGDQGHGDVTECTSGRTPAAVRFGPGLRLGVPERDPVHVQSPGPVTPALARISEHVARSCRFPCAARRGDNVHGDRHCRNRR